MKRNYSWLSFFILLGLMMSCSNGNADKTPTNTQKEATKVPDNNAQSPYQKISIAGFTRNQEGRFIPDDQSSKVDFVYIQTQLCQGCKRLNNLESYKEEIMLAPELKKAYTKKIGGKDVYFAGMLIKEEISIDEERSPAIIAEFMGGNNYIVSVSIYPNTGEASYEDYEALAIKFLEVLVKI